jgi:hypothetical protein
MVARVGVEIGKEGAEEAEYEGDQGQRQQRVKVTSIEVEPAEQAGSGRL